MNLQAFGHSESSTNSVKAVWVLFTRPATPTWAICRYKLSGLESLLLEVLRLLGCYPVGVAWWSQRKLRRPRTTYTLTGKPISNDTSSTVYQLREVRLVDV